MTDLVHSRARPVARDPILPRWWQTVDRWTMASVFMLFGLGIILALAASPPLAERNGLAAFYYVERQIIYGLLGLMVMLVVSVMSVQSVRRWAIVGFAGAFAAILLLPFFGTDFGKGAVRWYSFGFTSVQPSEFLKPVFVVFGAWLLAASFAVGGPPGKFLSFMIAVVVAGFLAMQPECGQAMLVLFTWAVMYFVAGAPILPIISMAAATVLAGVVAYKNSEHFASRIDGFMAVDLDPTTQLGYVARAISEGGLFGVGAGEGSVKWNLPDAHTDFIVAVAAEEYGLILVIQILVLFTVIVIRSLLRLIHEQNMFVRLAGSGLVAIFGAQAMINVGVAVRLLPPKGMTLPFISYGGSSLLAAGLTMGMILALTRSRPQGNLARTIDELKPR